MVSFNRLLGQRYLRLTSGVNAGNLLSLTKGLQQSLIASGGSGRLFESQTCVEFRIEQYIR